MSRNVEDRNTRISRGLRAAAVMGVEIINHIEALKAMSLREGKYALARLLCFAFILSIKYRQHLILWYRQSFYALQLAIDSTGTLPN